MVIIVIMMYLTAWTQHLHYQDFAHGTDGSTTAQPSGGLLFLSFLGCLYVFIYCNWVILRFIKRNKTFAYVYLDRYA